VDPVRAWQHALYRAAKADPGRRFHALWDKVYRRDVLWRAWIAQGVAGTTKPFMAVQHGNLSTHDVTDGG
jgi:hypothetical protein